MLMDKDMGVLKGPALEPGAIKAAPASNGPPRQRVADILLFGCREATKTVRLRKGRDLLVAGTRPLSLFVNHDGWLSRYKILHSGQRQIVNFILPGEVVGLQACVFKDSLYSVATLTDCALSAIPIEAFGRAIERNAPLAKALFGAAIGEAAILGEHLIDAGRRSACARVSHFLLEIFVRLEQVGHADHMSFVMPLTQEVIGDALGLSPVHVNRTLRALRDDGLIALQGKRVTLRDFAALCRLSDFEDSYLREGLGPRRHVIESLPAAEPRPREVALAP